VRVDCPGVERLLEVRDRPLSGAEIGFDRLRHPRGAIVARRLADLDHGAARRSHRQRQDGPREEGQGADGDGEEAGQRQHRVASLRTGGAQV
jgi:hypothetical protein